MEDQNVLLLFIISLVIILFTQKLVARKPNNNHPPSPPSLPVIGHLHHLKKPVHRTFLALSQTYGPIISLNIGTRRLVVISSRSLAEECFTRNDVVLANRPIFAMTEYLSNNCSAMGTTSYGDQWRNLRRIGANEVFSLRRLDASLNIRRDEVKSLLRKVFMQSDKTASGFTRVELKSALMELAFNVMMRVVAGKRYYGEDVSNAEEAKAFQEMIKEIFKYAGTSYPGDYVPVLRWIDYQGYEKRASAIGKKMAALLRGLVDESRKKEKMESEKMKEKSMIEHLLSLQASQPEYYADEVIKGLAQVFTFCLTLFTFFILLSYVSSPSSPPKESPPSPHLQPLSSVTFVILLKVGRC